MKTKIGILTATAAILLAGCVVTSVAPYYTPKDVVFEPALVGNWLVETNKTAGEVWKFDQADDTSYRFTHIEDSKAEVMEMHAFKLSGQLFLDIHSAEQDIHVIPPHYLMKVDQLSPTLKLAQINPDWLKSLLETNSSVIRHQVVKNGDKADDTRIVLTADTGELQKFVMQNVATRGAWGDELELFTEKSKK